MSKKLEDLIQNEIRDKGMSLAEFCRLLDVSVATYYGWLKGATPRPETMKKLDLIFGKKVIEDVFSKKVKKVDVGSLREVAIESLSKHFE